MQTQQLNELLEGPLMGEAVRRAPVSSKQCWGVNVLNPFLLVAGWPRAGGLPSLRPPFPISRMGPVALTRCICDSGSWLRFPGVGFPPREV